MHSKNAAEISDENEKFKEYYDELLIFIKDRAKQGAYSVEVSRGDLSYDQVQRVRWKLLLNEYQVEIKQVTILINWTKT